MAIYRRVCDKPFTKATNDLLRNPKVTSVAKIVLLCIASHRPDYRLTVVQLVAQIYEGRDAVRRALKELEKLGYLARVQRRGERGSVSHSDFYIVDDLEAGQATDFQAAVLTSTDDASSQVVAGNWISGDGKPDTKKTRSQETSNDLENRSPGASAGAEAPASPLTRRGSETEHDQDVEATNFLLTNLYSGIYRVDLTEIVIEFLRKDRDVDKPAEYLVSIYERGGQTGLEAIVEKALDWYDDLEAGRASDHKLFAEDWGMAPAEAATLADAFREAIAIRCDDDDLSAAVNEIHSDPTPVTLNACLAAIQPVIDARRDARRRKKEAWKWTRASQEQAA